ncbi:Putative disease resistance protein RGA3 [Linum perenne]
MAETIQIPVAKQILGKLGDLAQEQVGLLWTLKREIMKLKDTVSTIQAVLLDAEEKQTHNRQVKDWLEKLSDVMYDADDLLDDFSTEARRQAMAEDDSKRTNKESLHLEVRFEEVLPLPMRETDACPPTIVVGREDDKNNIIQLLLNGNCEANISVVPIVGIGGSGKTTLTQLVVDDCQVEAHFAVKVWVYVSQSFDIKVILEKMLQSITLQSEENLELNVLQAQLRKEIAGKRFLIVWEENAESWGNFGKYLTVGALGSTVLVTTRSMKVAEVVSKALKSEAKGLSLKESWDLLVKNSLDGKFLQNPAVERIGKKILKKCYGVPLAISTISGLLSSKNPETEWGLFLENELESISKEENAAVFTLKLSYNHLLPHMKHCFAYCKLFPKGHKFDIQMLVHFWVVQGYVESEEKGLACFKTLWWRSFFQEVETDGFGNPSECRMHDLMHDLADSVTGEKILKVAGLTSLNNVASNARHLALFDKWGEEEANDDGLVNANKVRTLICFKHLSREEYERVLEKFRRLRALVIAVEGSYSDASTQLCSIGKMKHLRLLVFKGHGMKSLPESVINLLNLKYLYFDHDDMIHMTKGIGGLKSLQTLPVFVVSKSRETVWAGLDELRELNALRGQLIIRNLVEAKSLGAGVYVLNGMLFLQSLILDWGSVDDSDDYDDDDDDDEEITPTMSNHDEDILKMLCPHHTLKKLNIGGGYVGVKLPSWLSTLVYLVEFSLKDCKKCEYLPPLHNFPCLKKLTISACPQLKGINNSEGSGSQKDWPSFHCLAYLLIYNCPKLTRLPAFPTVEGDLTLGGTSLEPLRRTMNMWSRGGGEDGIVPLSPSSTLVCPLSKLTKLVLYRIDDDLQSLPDEDCFISLQKLFLQECYRGVKVPSSLCSATTLTVIKLFRCKTVEYLPRLHKLPSLKKLKIEHCPKLKGCWWKTDDDDWDEYWPHFPCLSTLKIVGCPNLTKLPLFPTIEGRFWWCGTGADLLLRTMKMEVEEAHHSSSFAPALTTPLSKVGILELWEIADLESLPEEGHRNLTSLYGLVIVSCPRLTSLPPAMRHLTSLQTLIIRDCPQLTERCRKGDGEDWSNISHVQTIFLNGRKYCN